MALLEADPRVASVQDVGVGANDSTAYPHVAVDASIVLTLYPAVSAWLERVASQEHFIDDLEPYPPNASVLAGRSIYG